MLRVEPELLGERATQARDRRQGVRRPPGTVERDRIELRISIVERVVRAQPLELRHDLAVAAQREVGFDPHRQGVVPPFLEDAHIAVTDGIDVDPLERDASPQRKRGVEESTGAIGFGIGQGSPSVLDETFEAIEVDLVRLDLEDVAVARGAQHPALPILEGLAQG